MKQVLNRRGTIVVEEVPEPQCGRGQVKIALTHSLISAGTELRSVELQGQGLATRARNRPDLVKKVIERARSQGIQAAYRAVREKLDEPKALGYSATGIVREVASEVTGFAPGDRVSCGGNSAAHAEFVCVPENLVVHVPENVAPEHAAFATVGSIAMQGVRRANPQFGETFVVIGLGLVGQLVAQLCKAAGLHVLATDLSADRVALAKQLGAVDAWTPNDADSLGRVLTRTEGLGADGVIIAAGSQSSDTVRLAMDLLRERGRLSIVGVVGLDFPWDSFYAKELDVFMSRSYGPGRYDADYEERGMKYPLSHVRWTETENMAEVLRLIADGRLNVAPLVSELHPVGEAAQAYQRLESGEPKPIGVLLSHNGKLREAHVEAPGAAASRHPRKPAGVAVIGCGGFAKQERLPYLKGDAAFRVEMLVSRSGPKVKQLAEQYGAAKFDTDYRAALADPAVHLLVVASPHSTHAPIAIDAARAGKDVVMEKPMAVHEEELEAVYAAVKLAGVRFSVGFNRRFAPASMALKRFVESAGGRVSMIYRVNAGLVPPGSWIHAPEEGGGRIVGEACHFFDYCTWLIGSTPISVSAIAVSYQGIQFVGTDNLSSAVKYADGSTATIVYTTMGDAAMGKERVEVFAGGNAAVLEDFASVTVHGGKERGWSGSADKGHKAYVAAIGKAMAEGSDLPVPLDDAYLAHRLTFKALESARTGAVISL